MAKRKQSTPLSGAAIAAVRAAVFDGAIMRLTQDNLPCYGEIKALVEALGGRWVRNAKHHAFPAGVSAAELMLAACDRGEIPASNPLDYYPTPEVVVSQIVDGGAKDIFEVKRLLGEMNGRPCRFLEPSGGSGALAAVMHSQMRPGDELVIVEANPVLAAGLRRRFPAAQVVEGDFLSYTPEGRFDFILMNPPFAGTTYQKHINHAFSLLAPMGDLVAVAPNGFIQQADDFLAFVNRTGEFEPIPGSPFTGVSIPMSILRLKNDPSDDRERPYEGYLNWHHWHAVTSISNDGDIMRRLTRLNADDEPMSDADMTRVIFDWAKAVNQNGSYQRMDAALAAATIAELRAQEYLPAAQFRLESAA